jgi:hypothetical protein
MKRVAVLFVVGCALAACERSSELMLVIKAASGLTVGPGNDIDTLRVQVQPADQPAQEWYFTRLVELCDVEHKGNPTCRPQQYADDDYSGSLTLPLRLLFIPGDQGFDREIRIWVDALKTGYQEARLANGLRFKFSRGHRLWLELPLYRQCLDDIDCEAADQVCNKNRECESLMPSETEPPPDPSELDGGVDLAVPDLTVADLSEPPDLAHPCGMQVGDPCCKDGQACPGSLSCNPLGFCSDPTQCGQLGNDCCGNAPKCLSATAVCNVDNKCVPPCGANGQMCCTTGQDCLMGQCFVDPSGAGPDLCQACGSSAEICCPGNVCRMGFNCSGGSCTHCGAMGEVACTTGSACQGMLVPDSNGLCNPCGGTAGHGCCGAAMCNALNSLTCDVNDSPPLTAPQNVCIPCGSPGGWCCNDPGETKPCQTGLLCDGTKKCVSPSPSDMGSPPPCGGSGQACCPAMTQCMPTLTCVSSVCTPCGNSGQPCCPGIGDMCSCMMSATSFQQLSVQAGAPASPNGQSTLCP